MSRVVVISPIDANKILSMVGNHNLLAGVMSGVSHNLVPIVGQDDINPDHYVPSDTLGREGGRLKSIQSLPVKVGEF